MSKKGFDIVDHYRAMKRTAVAKRLGVSTKLFESVELEEEELREDDRLGGSKHKTDIVPDAGSMNHRAATGGSTGWGDEVAPSVNDKGSDLRTNQKMRGNKQGRIGLEEVEYGDMAKQEVGHGAKQGKQKPMQSIDEPTGVQAGSRDPGLRKKGPNTHKEDGMKENYDPAMMYADVPEGASWEETKAGLEKARDFYKGRAGRLNQNLAQTMERALNLHMKTQDAEAPVDPMSERRKLNESVNQLVKTVKTFRKKRGK